MAVCHEARLVHSRSRVTPQSAQGTTAVCRGKGAHKGWMMPPPCHRWDLEKGKSAPRRTFERRTGQEIYCGASMHAEHYSTGITYLQAGDTEVAEIDRHSFA